MFYARLDLTLSHYDAKAHLVVARRILDSLTPEYSQIGAVWLPLPHLLDMLPVQSDAMYRTGASAVGIYGPRGPSNVHVAKIMNPETQAVVRYDVFLGISERTIFMDGRPHPPEYAPHTFAGFSTGQWEGLALKFTTTHNKAGYLQRNGVPYSADAVVTEHWDFFADPNGSQWIGITSIVEDPKYLRQPFVTALNFRKEPDGSKWEPTPCV